MSDKKNEDYVVRIPDSPRVGERNSFMSKSPSRKPFNGASSTTGLNQSLSRLDNSPIISVLAYCLSSISMTMVNKYVVSGKGWNLSFFYLFIQVRILQILALLMGESL
jgi:GDP-mannose transporter